MFWKKRAAVPEYIWYISLIIIAVTLVVGIFNITKRADKNIEPPSNLQVVFDVKVSPQGEFVLNELSFIGDFDMNKDLPFIYLCYNGICANINDFFADPKAWIVRKPEGAIGLKGPVLFTDSTVIKNFYGNSSLEIGSLWEIYYGNPTQQGVTLKSDAIDQFLPIGREYYTYSITAQNPTSALLG